MQSNTFTNEYDYVCSLVLVPFNKTQLCYDLFSFFEQCSISHYFELRFDGVLFIHRNILQESDISLSSLDYTKNKYGATNYPELTIEALRFALDLFIGTFLKENPKVFIPKDIFKELYSGPYVPATEISWDLSSYRQILNFVDFKYTCASDMYEIFRQNNPGLNLDSLSTAYGPNYHYRYYVSQINQAIHQGNILASIHHSLQHGLKVIRILNSLKDSGK